MHCWFSETAKEKKASVQDLKKRNEELKPEMKRRWEITNELTRLSLRNLPGIKPTWKFKKDTGKMVRNSRGGID